jgi:hypothetical protein
VEGVNEKEGDDSRVDPIMKLKCTNTRSSYLKKDGPCSCPCILRPFEPRKTIKVWTGII